jgi:hypothetical protein
LVLLFFKVLQFGSREVTAGLDSLIDYGGTAATTDINVKCTPPITEIEYVFTDAKFGMAIRRSTSKNGGKRGHAWISKQLRTATRFVAVSIRNARKTTRAY